MVGNNPHINVGVLVESKREYTQQLVDQLSPLLYSDFHDMYREAAGALERNYFPNKTAKEVFTMSLQNVKKWVEDDKVIQMYARRVTDHCSWVMELLKTIMVVNTMVLAAIRNNDQPEQVNVEVPEIAEFVFELYKCTASKMPVSVFIYLHSGDDDRIEKAEEKMQNVIEKCIVKVISDMLPIKNLIATYTQNWNTNNFTCDQNVEATTPSPPVAPPSGDAVEVQKTHADPTTADPEHETATISKNDDVTSEDVGKQNVMDDDEDENADRRNTDNLNSDDEESDYSEEVSNESTDEEERDMRFAQQAAARQRQIQKKLRKMGKLKQKHVQKHVPAGKEGVPFDHMLGEKRKTVKISKDVPTPKPSSYLGNDFDETNFPEYE